MRAPDSGEGRLIQKRRPARLRQADSRHASVKKGKRYARTTTLARGTRRCRIHQRTFYGPPHLSLKARHRASARRSTCRRLLLRGVRGRLPVDLLWWFCWLRANDGRLRLRRRRSGIWWSNLRRRWRDLRGRWGNLRLFGHWGSLFGHRRSFRDHRRRIRRSIGRRRRSGYQRYLHGWLRRVDFGRVLCEPADDGKKTKALQQQRGGKRNGQCGALLRWAEMIGCRDAHNDCTPTWRPSQRGPPGRCRLCGMHPSQRAGSAALRCQLRQS